MKIWPDVVCTSIMSVSGKLKLEYCCEVEGSVGSMLSSFQLEDQEVISQTKRQSKSSQTVIPLQQQ